MGVAHICMHVCVNVQAYCRPSFTRNDSVTRNPSLLSALGGSTGLLRQGGWGLCALVVLAHSMQQQAG